MVIYVYMELALLGRRWDRGGYPGVIWQKKE